MNREAFLDRIRQAAAAGRLHRAHLRPSPPPLPEAIDPRRLVERFVDEAEAVGGQVTVVDERSQLGPAFAALVARLQPRSALLWQHPLLDETEIERRLSAEGCVAWDHPRLAALEPSTRRETLLACEFGVTSATWALADTGSLVLASAPGRERLASLLPPVHVALVTAGQLVANLPTLVAEHLPRDFDAWPSNLVLVTGPSKTGDIELTLTTGVHGPGQWHLFVSREA